MKSLSYTVIPSLLLLVVGLLTISLVTNPSPEEQRASSLPNAHVPTPTFIQELPDSEYIPIHPDAVETRIFNESGVPGDRSYAISYRVPILFGFVDEFYKETLTNSGWSRKAVANDIPIYTRKVSTASLSWHMYLELSMTVTESGHGTMVGMKYGRYPEGEADMPVYPNARQVAVSRHEEPSDEQYVVSPVRVTLKTYVTSASPDELENFYNANLEQYGWVSYAEALIGGDKDKKVSITSEEGLYFASSPPFMGYSAPGRKTSIYMVLYITAKVQQDGHTEVQLRMEETESLAGQW